MPVGSERIESAFRHHHDEVRRFLLSRTGCAATAEDILQDTYIRLIGTEGEMSITDLRSYMFKIACNLMIDNHRRFVRTTALTVDIDDNHDLPAPEPDAELIMSLRDEIRQMERGLSSLSQLARRIFWLSRAEGFRNYEIADMLGVCLSTVEKNINKATRCCRLAAGAC